MTKITNDCVDCGFPCNKNACQYYNVIHSVCDVCKKEDVRLYNIDRIEVCLDCLKEYFPIVKNTEDFDD